MNADSVISGTGESVHGYNLFAYCFNNPVAFSDETGGWPTWADVKKWAKKNIVEPVKKFVSNVVKIAVNESVADITNKRREIIFDNISASAGISVGVGGGIKFSAVGVEGAIRSDIVGIQLQDGKITMGHPGKSGGSLSVNNFTLDQHFENFEPFGGVGTHSGEPTNVKEIDYGLSFGSTNIFMIGYHYDISISFLGIFTDTIEYIYCYGEEES